MKEDNFGRVNYDQCTENHWEGSQREGSGA